MQVHGQSFFSPSCLTWTFFTSPLMELLLGRIDHILYNNPFIHISSTIGPDTCPWALVHVRPDIQTILGVDHALLLGETLLKSSLIAPSLRQRRRSLQHRPCRMYVHNPEPIQAFVYRHIVEVQEPLWSLCIINRICPQMFSASSTQTLRRSSAHQGVVSAPISLCVPCHPKRLQLPNLQVEGCCAKGLAQVLSAGGCQWKLGKPKASSTAPSPPDGCSTIAR